MFINATFDVKKFWNEGGLLLFPHVPKTGGMSIRRLLSDYIEDGVFVFADGSLDFEQACDKLKRAFAKGTSTKLIIGHMPFGLHVLFPDRPVKYLSVVRDPVERLASHYMHDYHYHILYSERGLYIERGDLLLRHEGFTEFVKAASTLYGERETDYAYNDQCRLLFPDLLRELSSDSLEAPPEYDGVLRRMNTLAQQWYALIGLQEELGEFVTHLCAMFGKLPPKVEIRENSRYQGNHCILTPAERTLVEQWNFYDRVLFRFVGGGSSTIAEDGYSELDRVRTIADIRLKALQHCRLLFLELRADRERAQDIMDRQHGALKKLRLELDRYQYLVLGRVLSATQAEKASGALVGHPLEPGKSRFTLT